MRFSKSVLVALLGLFTWSRTAAAQCPQPDGLDGGPCCAVASETLPNFPNFAQRALEICWLDCNVNAVLPYTARWKHLPFKAGTIGGPTVAPCGESLATVELRDGAGVLQFSGTLRLQYSRTWQETGPGGFPLQVWRFLVNGDLRAVGATVAPCPLPPCAAAFGGNVRFTGYLDQSTSCALVPAVFQQAWMLTHACDFIDHRPGFPRGGAFHPNRSYTFVGPSAGFVPGPLQPLEGTLGSGLEAMRTRNLGTTGLPTTCDFEERAGFTLAQIAQFCTCGLPGTNQFHNANLSVFGSCGSTVASPIGPLLPGFISMGIGTWTIPGTYPGIEAVRWNAGDYTVTDGCTGAAQQEIYFGATTIGGYFASSVNAGGLVAILPLTFIDQSNALRLPAGVGLTMNLPYISDRFLNLNH
jgi:hypothetical protein